MQISLQTPPGYSIHSVIHSHGWMQLAPFEEIDEGQALAYTFHLSDGSVQRVAFHQANEHVNIISAGEKPLIEQEKLCSTVRWMLSMDTDLTGFYTAARQEPRLQKAIQNGAGRILRSPTIFEDIVKTILTTNTLWATTKSMTRKLVANYGAANPENPEMRAFPTPQILAEVSEEELMEKVRVGYRAPFILQLAQRVAEGSLDLEVLRISQLPTAELRKEFLAIKGLGPYAAANLLMLLGRYDFLPIDSWALKMVSLEWHAGEPVKPKDVEAAFDRWGAYKGIAYWLWDWTKTP